VSESGRLRQGAGGPPGRRPPRAHLPMLPTLLLYATIFLKFAGVPYAVALFTQMSQAFHGLISPWVFRPASGAFRDGGGGSVPGSEGSQMGSGIDCFVDDTPVRRIITASSA